MRYLVVILVVVTFSWNCKKEEKTTTECEINCALLGQVGPCNAAFQRFYFDPVEKKCLPFTWGGCGGVVPFETLEACELCECK